MSGSPAEIGIVATDDASDVFQKVSSNFTDMSSNVSEASDALSTPNLHQHRPAANLRENALAHGALPVIPYTKNQAKGSLHANYALNG